MNSVCKICRRAGEKLFLKGERCLTQKCAMIRRNYPPGVHGRKRQRAPSDYAIQLRQRKKTRLIPSDNSLVGKLYELKLASSHGKARQLISHGHILVNSKKITIPSYQIKEKDIIKLKK